MKDLLEPLKASVGRCDTLLRRVLAGVRRSATPPCPPDLATITGAQANHTVTLSWTDPCATAPNRATKYAIEVDDKNGTRVATERILKATTYAITSGVIYYGSIYRWSVTATAANGKTAKTDGAFQTLGPPPATLIVARDGSNIRATGSGYPRNRTINITVHTSWQGSAAHVDIDNRGPNVLHPVTATSDGAGELSYSFPAQSALEVSSATHQTADPHIGATVKVAVQAVVVPAEPTGSTNIVHGQFTWV